MKSLIHSVRIALRILAKSPGFTSVALVTLMLGIGATSTIFSVLDKTIIVPLPHVDRPETLAWFFEQNGRVDTDRDTVAPANYLDWKERANRFSSVSALFTRGINVVVGSEPERVDGVVASADFFATTGTTAALGRLFEPQDDRPGAERVVVLSYSYWVRRHGGRAEALGTPLVLDGAPHTIVGVLPKGFYFPRAADVYIPLILDGDARAERLERTVAVVGRIKTGSASIAAGSAGAPADVRPDMAPNLAWRAAEDQMRAISAQLAQMYPDSNRGWSVALVPVRDLFVDPPAKAGMALAIAVGLVLLIACANVANLLLARGASRAREMAIRAALGASRGQLLAQVLVESLVLSSIGASLGVLFALWGVDWVVGLIPSEMTALFPGVTEVAVDRRCLAFTAALAVVSVVLFGLAPALRASRPNLADVFKEEGPTSTPSRKSRRLNQMLVTVQVALALVLTGSAAVATAILVRSQHVELGFLPDELLTARLHVAEAKYPDANARIHLSEELQRSVSTLVGVRSVAIADTPPLQRQYETATFAVEGMPIPDAAQKPDAKRFVVSAGYFSTMGIPITAGRAFDERDRRDGPAVVIISQRLADLRFGRENPVGRFLDILQYGRREIVGVAGNVHDGYRRDEGFLYLPYAQTPTSEITLLIRSEHDPRVLMAPVREQVRRIDWQQPITRMLTGTQLVRDSLLIKRLMTQLFVALAAVALVLAAVGIYGVVAFTVGQRRHELSIRSALGATRNDLLRLVLREAMVVIAAGVVVGLPLCALSGQGVARALDAPPGGHGAIWAASTLVMSAVALLASWLPTWRAVREPNQRAA